MIRSNRLEATPKRRIAVIRMPRPQQTRLGFLGVIRNGEPSMGYSNAGWTTLSDGTPDSADNFMASVLAKQARARETTPGTLVWTPAATMQPPIAAPWNSWSTNINCNAPAPTAVNTGSNSKFLFVAGLIMATAAGVYLVDHAAKGGR